MENHTPPFKARLGIFIVVGIAIFVMAIFIIGKQQNLFNPVFKITTNFRNISGLQAGNNILLLMIQPYRSTCLSEEMCNSL